MAAKDKKLPAADQGQTPTQGKGSKVGVWNDRVEAACKAYDMWASRYRTEKLEDYYLGHQWIDSEKYAINLCFPTIETKIPSMMFFRPRVHVVPKPARADDPMSAADDRVRLMEDTIQTFLSREESGFMENVNLAMRESFYRFGVVQVMYTLESQDNPNADRPMLKEDGTELTDSDGRPIPQPSVIPLADGLYVKWIPADTFRVGSTNAHNVTGMNDWIGYYEWQYKEDIAQNPKYKNKTQVKSNGKISTRYFNPDVGDPEDRGRYEMVKVWKIWDLRTKTRHVFPDGGDQFFIENEPWSQTPAGKPFHPFAFLRRHPILKSWYPLPPMFNWLHPQNELNETREMQRIHRKRAIRRYLVQKGAIAIDELRKLEGTDDMVYAEVGRLDAIRPMEDAPLDRSVMLNVPGTKEDFLNVTGIGGDRRGVAEAETATQASIIDTNAKIRDSYERQQVSKFISDICWLMLETARAHFTLPLVIQINVDPQAPQALQEVVRVASTWQSITVPQLGAFDFEALVDVESLSPITEDLLRAQWSQVLSLMSNPPVAMMLLSSPALMKKTMGLYGIRSDRDLTEVANAARALIGAMMQQNAGPGGVPGSAPPANPKAIGDGRASNPASAQTPNLEAVLAALGGNGTQ